MFSCKDCNISFARNSDFMRHCNTIRHKKRTELSEKLSELENTMLVEPVTITTADIKQNKIKILRRKTSNHTVSTQPFLEEIIPSQPDISFDALVNLFRFTRDNYTDLPEKGIIKTCVELLCEKINTTSEPRPFLCDDKKISIYYRGNWIIENLDDIINKIKMRNDDTYDEAPSVFCELLDMFIENMMLQFRRNQELNNYHSISREIENGYRSGVQIKIIKGICARAFGAHTDPQN